MVLLVDDSKEKGIYIIIMTYSTKPLQENYAFCVTLGFGILSRVKVILIFQVTHFTELLLNNDN